MKKKSRTTHKIKGNLKNLFYLGFFFAIALISWSHAMKIAIVPYVVSIKRTSILIASIYGFILFKETHIKKRLGGAVIMVIGAILISLS